MCFQHQRIRSSSFSFCFSHSLKQLIYQTSTLTLGPSTAPALRGPGLPAGTVTVLYKHEVQCCLIRSHRPTIYTHAPMHNINAWMINMDCRHAVLVFLLLQSKTR